MALFGSNVRGTPPRANLSEQVACNRRVHPQLTGAMLVFNSPCSDQLLFRGVMKSGFKSNERFLNFTCQRLRESSLRRPRPLCYTFIRDPVARFFSQYAELSERAVSWQDKWERRELSPRELRWPRRCPCRNPCSCHIFTTPWVHERSSAARVLGLLSTAERCGWFEPHLLPQRAFLDNPARGTRSSRALACSSRNLDVVGRIENASEGYRRVWSQLGLQALEHELVFQEHRRAEMNRSYRAARYMSQSSFSAHTAWLVARRVCRLYNEDFCTLSLPMPPECAGIAPCQYDREKGKGKAPSVESRVT